MAKFRSIADTHSNHLQPLSDVLDKISEEYEVIITYNSRLLSHIEVNFELKKEEQLEIAVNRALKTTDLQYKQLTEKYYIVYKKDRTDQKKIRKIERKFEQIQKLEQQENINIQQNIPDRRKMISAVFGEAEKLLEDRPISGKVVDADGAPLIGATVQVKGTSTGTITDLDGSFSFDVPDDATTLVISYTGYETTEMSIVGLDNIQVTLATSISQLDEVVVVGYGRQKKSDLTGSVSSVSAEDIANVPVSRIDQALQGRAAGVQVTQTSGAPGAGTSIRVRGGNSITGSNEPLWVIDGIIVGTNFDLNNLNANDIESIEILKDASSIAIYGSRGANGVVLVTTKSGANSGAGKPQVNVGVYTSTQLVPERPAYLTQAQQIDYTNEDARFRGVAEPFPGSLHPILTTIFLIYY